jgi:hypothetical protein
MRTPLRILVVLVGAFFALQGASWLVSPAGAAQALGMPLLDGLGRSTQIGDFTSFFLAIGATTLLGARPGEARLLLVPAGLLGAAAVARTLAFAVHGAAFASVPIAIEVTCAALLAVASRKLAAAS